jgi:hypothetical protein
MATTGLKHRYHDSSLEGHRIGPQRELVLEIRLDGVWNPGGPEIVHLRFGAIDNMTEVRDFFEGTAKSQVPDRVERLASAGKGKWILEMDRGRALTIATEKAPQEQ